MLLTDASSRHPPLGDSCSWWSASLCLLAATVGAAAYASIAAPSLTAPWTRAADRPSTLAARDNISDAARRLIEPLCVDDHLAPSVFLVDAGACGESSLRDDVATHLRAIRPMPGASREDAPGYFDADDRDLIPTRWSRWLRSNADECAAVAADVDVVAAAEDVDVADAARVAPTAHLHADPAYSRRGTARRIRDAYPEPSQRDALRFIVTVCDPESTGALDATRTRSASGNVESPKNVDDGESRYDVVLAEYVAAFGAERVLVASSERYRRDFAGVLRDIAEHVDSATRGLDAKTTEAREGHGFEPRTEQNASDASSARAKPKRSEGSGRAGDEGSDETARRRDVRRDVRDAWRAAAANVRDMGCPDGTRGPGGGKGAGLKLAGWDAASREERALDWGFVPETSREGECVGDVDAERVTRQSRDASVARRLRQLSE